MAFDVKVGSFAAATSTGNQAVTVGFQPKAVVFFYNERTSDGNSVDASIGMAVAVSSTDRRALHENSDDAAGTTETQDLSRENRCINLCSPTGEIKRADFVSMDANGFTVNWDIVDANATIINYMALGGADLTNVISQTNDSPTSTGNKAYTEAGFEPDCAIFIPRLRSGIGDSDSRANMGVGFAVSTTKRACACFNSEDVQSTSKTMRSQLSNRCIVTVYNDATLQEADFVSFDTDGYTLNWTKVSGVRDHHVLLLKGGQYHVATGEQKVTTGTKGYTDVGFTPKGLILASFNNPSDSSVLAHSRLSVGMASATTERGCIWSGDKDAVGTTECDQDLDRTKIIKMLTEGTPTTDAAADLDSLDDDGFTLNWTIADATLREFIYLAMGDDAAIGADSLVHKRKRYVEGLVPTYWG